MYYNIKSKLHEFVEDLLGSCKIFRLPLCYDSFIDLLFSAKIC